ncbi:hypothetical protein Tco_0578292 [Tanacetum coccineum]
MFSTPSKIAQILRIPFEGVCLNSHEWSISSLQRILDPHPNLYPHPIEDPSLVRDALFKERPEPILRKIKGDNETLEPFQMLNTEFKDTFNKWSPTHRRLHRHSLDYVPGPEEPEQAPLSPNYVSGPEYPEYLAPSDEEVPVEDQPYVVADSPITLSSGYVADSDPEEDPKEDPEEDSEDGPVDYLTDGGDGDDDDSSDDDEEEEEASKEEDEEHLAPPFKTDESAATPPSPLTYRTTARISIRPEAPMPFPSEEEVERLLALPPPPPSPLISLSPPSIEERLARCLAAPALPSSPLPIVPHPYGSPNHVCAPPGFRAAMDRLRASSPSTTSITAITTSTIITIFTATCTHIITITITTTTTTTSITVCTITSRPYKVGESSTAARPTGGHKADYGFIGTLDAETKRHRAEEISYGIRDDIYAVIEDAQDRHTQLSQKVDVLIEDRQFHQETMLLIEQEALISREAWAHSVGLSLAVYYELHAYMTHTQIQDHRIASQEALTVTLVTHVSFLQGQLSTALGQIQALQDRDPTHVDDPEGANSYNHVCFPVIYDVLYYVMSILILLYVVIPVITICHQGEPLLLQAAVAARAAATAAVAAAPMIAAAVEQLIKKMESVFHISNCAVENQVKFAICTFLGNALTWWNSYMKTVTQDVDYAVDWKALKKMMTGTDVASYTLRFQELALMCGRMFHEESDEVEKYVGGLLDMIWGKMDQKVLTITERQAEQKRKLEFNQGHQQQNKRQNTGRAYTAGPGEKREYTGSLLLSSGPNGNNNNHGNSETTQNAGTCYECGVQGHFMRLSEGEPLLLQAAVAARAAATAAVTAAPMIAAAVEQLMKARVSAALANHENL